MNGVVSMVHSTVSGNSRPLPGSFQKGTSAGFGNILAEIQGKEMLPVADVIKNESPQNMDGDLLEMLNQMAMSTLANIEETDKASANDFIDGLVEQMPVLSPGNMESSIEDKKLDLETDELSINTFIDGLVGQLTALSPESMKLLKNMISQIQQFIQNPNSIDSADLLDHAQLQRLTDLEQLTDNLETKPVFASMYLLLKELAQVVPNAQEQLKQYKQEANGQSMPSLAQVEELIKKMEDRLSLSLRNPFNQTDNIKKFLLHKHPFMEIQNGGKFSSQQLMNGQTSFTNRVMQTSLMDNQLPKSTQSVNLAGSTELIISSEIDPVVAALPMSKVEQFVLHMGPINGKADSVKLYQEFQQILAKSTFGRSVNNSRLTIRLAPEHLGSLKIELIKQDQVMIARMITSTQQAKELLESQLSSLKQALINAHIQVEKIDIQQQFQPLERFLTQPDQQQGHSQQHSKSNEENEDKEENEGSKSFLSSLEEELLNINV